jgi:hypothetical protein
MLNNYFYSKESEKLVVQVRNNIIIEALKAGNDVICDDCNINPKNFDDICKLIRKNDLECWVVEKSFYVDLQDAINRNAKREGFAKIPEEAIQKMWKLSGKQSFKNYKVREEIITNEPVEEIFFNKNLSSCLICDVDNCISLFNSRDKNGDVKIVHKGAHVRDPYDASTADRDMVNEPLKTIINRLSANNQIIFLSGRLEKFRPQTESFLNENFYSIYKLYMRKDGDIRPDEIVKKELFDNHIRNQYNCLCVFDDRLKVCKMWHKIGLKLFRFGNPCADF